jgi:CRP-like cAMP-binding protein
MITNLEKTLYLKDSSLFKDIPAKELIYVANCLNEVSLIKNTLVFKDGDIGDSMYFIIKGEIKISKGDIELVIFKKGDYFGEMSLLDGEVRSADATSLNDSILLKLDARDFEKIMYSNDQIMKGIVGMLSQRLRDANNLLNKN